VFYAGSNVRAFMQIGNHRRREFKA
jgi:hypothetical protein